MRSAHVTFADLMLCLGDSEGSDAEFVCEISHVYQLCSGDGNSLGANGYLTTCELSNWMRSCLLNRITNESIAFSFFRFGYRTMSHWLGVLCFCRLCVMNGLCYFALICMRTSVRDSQTSPSRIAMQSQREREREITLSEYDMPDLPCADNNDRQNNKKFD